MDTLVGTVLETDHIRGYATSPITLIEYGDFECPDCGAAYHHVEAWLHQFDGKLRVIFRHMPLDQLYPIHPHATAAARAAEAASKQGKFWEMHDHLYLNQEALEDADLTDYAELLGLDSEKFEHDIADPQLNALIEKHLASGKEYGVTATPGFFLNGERVENPRDYDALEARLRELAQ